MSGEFENTRWSLIARIQGDTTIDPGKQSGRMRALDELCRIYWTPVYVFTRRRGSNPTEAEDLTQQFFAVALEKELFRAADQERGRLRNFLLTAVKRFLADEIKARGRIKRGGHAQFVWIDAAGAESAAAHDLCDEGLTPDQAFERRWAQTFLEHCLLRVRGEFEGKGKLATYEALIPLLPENDRMSQSDLIREAAQALGSSDGAVRVSLHRMRKRYREIVEEEAAATLLPGEDIDDELNELMAAVSGG